MTDEESLEEGKNCCKNRTWLEIALIVLTSLMALFIVGSYGIDLRMFHMEEEPESNVCTTTECVKTAAEVLARIDPSINPCEDFYRFSCGTFAKNSKVLDFDNEISAFSMTNDLVENQLRCMLEKEIEEDEAEPFALLKSLYKSCMDVENVNAHSVDALKMWFDKSGGWPVLAGNVWDEENFNIKNAVDILCENLVAVDSIFFEMSVEKDPDDNEKKMLFMDGITFYNDTQLADRTLCIDGRPLPLLIGPPVVRGYVSSNIDELRKDYHGRLVQEYYEYIIEVTSFLGAPKIRAAKEMRDVMDLEVELIRIAELDRDEESDSRYTRMTLHELQKTYGYIDWLTHINKMIYPAKKRRTNDEVIVTNPNYFKNLESLLQEFPKKTLANYIHWATVYYLTPYLHEDLRNMFNAFESRVHAVNEPRWTFCINNGPTLARKALYSRYYLNNDSVVAVQDMVQGIKSQFSTLIEETEWMDDNTKEKALEKAEKAEVLIDYPEEFQDDELIEEHYKDLDIDPENFFDSMLNVGIFDRQQVFSELDEPLDDTDWRKITSFFTWNYYVALHGTGEMPVTLPVTAFQSIFFNNDRPRYMNYGSIGFVIGNQLTHSIHQRETKEEDMLDWWQPKTRAAFKKKTACIQDPDEDSKQDDEDGHGFIATAVGMAAVKEAYLAYKNWTEVNWEEETLPGLEYTPGQLFWISLGNTFCSATNMDDESDWKSAVIYGDNRKFVNVLAMNSEYFPEDFECPEDSNMNPKTKCEIW